MPENYNNTAYYLRKRYEMCREFVLCEECPLSTDNNGKALNCREFEKDYLEAAIAAVREWHESKTKKYTYLDDFLAKFPNALTGISGRPLVKACNIYPEIKNIGEGTCIFKDCDDCWNMEKEREDE